MRKFLIPTLLLTSLLTPFCFAAEQTRTVAEFKSIRSSGVFNLIIDVGQAQSIKLKGDEKWLSRIKLEVQGDTLILSGQKNKNFNTDEKVDVVITVPVLHRLNLNGVGETEIRHISGDNFNLNYEGVGSVKAQGNVKNLTLVAKGVGEINTQALKTQQASVVLEGLGAVSVHASSSLNANVSGIGSLTYYGKPPQLKTQANGLGHISSGD